MCFRRKDDRAADGVIIWSARFRGQLVGFFWDDWVSGDTWMWDG